MTDQTTVRVTDPETGMYAIGYIGQTREELKKSLEYRKDQLSVIPLRKGR